MAIATPSVTEVRAVITTTKTDAEILLVIDDAVLILEDVPTTTAKTASVQKAIVKYVTAHLLSLDRSGALTSKAIGDASESFAVSQNAFGAGLLSTVYGQRAILFDNELRFVGAAKFLFEAF